MAHECVWPILCGLFKRNPLAMKVREVAAMAAVKILRAAATFASFQWSEIANIGHLLEMMWQSNEMLQKVQEELGQVGDPVMISPPETHVY